MIGRLLLLPSRHVFILSYLAANFMFLAKVKRRPFFWGRAAVTAILFYSMIFLYQGNHPSGAFWGYLGYILSILLAGICAFLCHDISWEECLFCVNAGYITQHISSLFRIYACFLPNPGLPAQIYYTGMQLIFLAVPYPIIYAAWGRRLRNKPTIVIQSWKLLLLMVSIVLTDVVLYSEINGSMVFSTSNRAYFAFLLMNVVFGFCLLGLQFALLLQETLESELQMVKLMLHKEKLQYQMSRETVDQINRRCHDMRHQIHDIGHMIAMDPQTIQDMENVIGIYDAFAKTGNQALDIILAEKSLLCQRESIALNSMVDGAQLDFMKAADIYSLFGNMMDNAIQSVLKLEPEMRVIGLSVRREGNLISINSHNYYQEEIRMENGLPTTSQEDKSIHGYGIKSMVAIVEQYGGTFSFQAEEGIFNVNILLPVKKTAAA